MKIAHLDCFSGISGDMLLGGLVDAGADLRAVEAALRGLPLSGYSIKESRVRRAGIAAARIEVVVDNEGGEARRWSDISSLIGASALTATVKEKALSIFRLLFQAEAAVHGEPFEEVHLHELGGTDCLVDIVGSLVALDLLGIERVTVSPVNTGSGTVETSHGMLPVPAPATAELLRGFPVYSSGVPFELTTPTGAALVAGLARPSAMPEMTVERVGYGAGSRELPDSPNLLRLFIGGAPLRREDERVVVIETNIDDMNPQIYEDVMAKLFGAGALDVSLEQIIMKKGRPAVRLTVLCAEGTDEAIREIIFRETTTIGLRYTLARRQTLEREIVQVRTRFGDVRVKLSRLRGRIMSATPEYDDLRGISAKTGVPVKILSAEVLKSLGSVDIPV